MPEHSERDREKLVELFEKWGLPQYVPFHTERAMLADYLLANGVTVGCTSDADEKKSCHTCRNRCACKSREAFELLKSMRADTECSGYEPEIIPPEQYDAFMRATAAVLNIPADLLCKPPTTE